MTCPPEHSHKDHCYARHGCRCESCRASRSVTARNWYQRLTPEERYEYNLRRRLSRGGGQRGVRYTFEPWQIAVAERAFGK